jgi:23S rRNA (uracil1939-C5)-methyltransferase
MQHTASPSTVEATVSSLAPGGSGVALVDHEGQRRAIFVAHVVPGDRVRIAVDWTTRPARGAVLELLEAGPDRVAPPCRWVNECGACDFMHVSPAAQARVHVEHVREALPRAWHDAPIEIHTAPEGLRYRVRTRLHVRCGRGGRVIVGLHGAGTHQPVDVDQCAVLHPVLDEARRALAPLFAGCSGRGEVQLALGDAGRPVCDVRWSGDLAPACFGRFERAVQEGSLAGARFVLDDARRPATVGDPTPWIAGADGAPLRLAPGGFGQANEAMNAELARHVGALTREARSKKAVELYAGAGNLTVLIAPSTNDLVCVEASREACDAARANLAARGLAARVVEADADDYVWKPSTDLVVLDPPRTGARAAVERLAASRVAHVVYVSCDAPTLGRDLALLEPTYSLRSLATFEMFPQTSHVEIVASLARRRAGGGSAGAGGES